MVVRFQDLGEDLLEYSVREEILKKDNQGEQFCPPLNQKYHEESIERLAYRQFGDH